jgi:hypothetical protein
MFEEYRCPLVETDISDTICYDIQMVTGPGNLIKKSILNDYGDLFDASKVTDERAERFCSACPFNQLTIGVRTKNAEQEAS